MKIRICVPLAAPHPLDLIPLIQKAQSEGADLIEIRLDYMDKLEGIEKVVENASVPLIATNRQHQQGGSRHQDEETRIQNLIEAARSGFQYADIELTTKDVAPVTLELKDLGVKPIVSFHDFKSTPSHDELERIVNTQIASGAELCKMITTANNVEDNLTCFQLLTKMGQSTRVVCFAMGENGILSRVLSPIFGGYFTYASLQSGMETATGQISISELQRLYRILGVRD